MANWDSPALMSHSLSSLRLRRFTPTSTFARLASTRRESDKTDSGDAGREFWAKAIMASWDSPALMSHSLSSLRLRRFTPTSTFARHASTRRESDKTDSGDA